MEANRKLDTLRSDVAFNSNQKYVFEGALNDQAAPTGRFVTFVTSIILYHETSMPTETGQQILGDSSDDVKYQLEELKDIDEILRGKVSV